MNESKSDQRVIVDELEQSRKRLTAAVKHSGLQYWEYDMKNNRATLSDKSKEDFRMGEIIEDFPESWIRTGYIYPEDVGKYRQMIKKIKNGRPAAEWESRVFDLKTGEYRWMKIRYTTIFDDNGVPSCAIATAQDVNTYMELEARFLQTLVQNGLWSWDYDIKRREIINYNFSDREDPYGYSEKVIPNVPESVIAQGTIYKEDIEAYRELYRKIDQGEKQVSAQIRGWSAQQEDYVWQELIFTVVCDLDGKPVRAICSSRDISGEKRLEQRYLEENQYREEIASSMLSVCVLNLSRQRLEEIMMQGNVVEIPQELAKTMDYRERIRYFVCDGEISDEENAKLSPANLIQKYLNGENFVSAEYSIRTCGEDSLIRVHVDCRILKRPKTGELIAFFYESDVTQEYCMGHIMDLMVEYEYDFVGLIFVPLRTIYSYSRKEGDAFSGIRSNQFDEICEKFVWKRVNPKEADELIRVTKLDYIREKLEKESTYTIEFSACGQDGSMRRKEARFSYINRKEKIISVLRRDIEDIVCEEKRKQEQLELALNFAERANSTKSEFLTRMSHEMRTPMNAIMGLVELAEQEREDENAVRDYLKKIKSSSEHLLNLINDVLDMSKVESGKMTLHPRSCRFFELTESVGDVIKPLCGQKNIMFEENAAREDMVILADKLRFKQVLLNLLSNAVKFTPEGGTICFRCKTKTGNGKVEADFEISDNGIGMSEAFQKRMFVPFTQEERNAFSATQGTGLGLSISKAIIDKMNGTITVESSLGKGTCFHIYVEFPLAEDKEGTVFDCAPDFERGTKLLEGKRILMAEDHPMNQMIAKRILQNNGMRVITADTGKECVDIFVKSENRYFDAVLMDIRMPVMDGLSAARAIRRLTRSDAKTVPIIAMTANAFDEDVRKTREAGMNAHLAKPIEPTKMLRTLAEWIKKSQEKK